MRKVEDYDLRIGREKKRKRYDAWLVLKKNESIYIHTQWERQELV